MYQSMKALGRETLLVVYPDEYHEFKTPSHIKDLHERFLAWYAHYVKADGTPARPPEKQWPNPSPQMKAAEAMHRSLSLMRVVGRSSSSPNDGAHEDLA